MNRRPVQHFNDNVSTPVREIEANSGLSLGAACQLLNLTPWAIRVYGEAVTQLHPEIKFDRHRGFEVSKVE